MSRKSKTLTIEELRAKQAEITRQLEQAEQAERAMIGKEAQRITGLASWKDINAKWQLIPRDSTLKMADEDGIFKVKDPFHPDPEAVKNE